MADFGHEIISKGNCVVCGKPIDIDNIFLCSDCIKKKSTAQRWIPCSEKLPQSKSDVYLACTRGGNIVSASASYIAEAWEWQQKHKTTDDADVVAWKPMIEPYKES